MKSMPKIKFVNYVPPTFTPVELEKVAGYIKQFRRNRETLKGFKHFVPGPRRHDVVFTLHESVLEPFYANPKVSPRAGRTVALRVSDNISTPLDGAYKILFTRRVKKEHGMVKWFLRLEETK